MRIVLDAMGSDNYPGPEVEAALSYAQLFQEPLTVVGQRELLEPLLRPAGDSIHLVNAPDIFEMTDKLSPRVLRTEQNSMGVGMDLVKNGDADAFVTVGNTAGAMAIGLTRLGRIKGVKRPALTAPFPVSGGTCIVLDVGANTECEPEYLLQFGLMGSVYAQALLGISNPRVGLLSNGEEPGKGNDLVKASYPLLQASDLNFIGNVEGKELFGGEADVVVTDGFTGNVLMKSSEAVAKLMTERLRAGIMSSTRTKLGGLLAKPAFDGLRKELDPREVGAVPLLGIDGLVFVGHGRSDARAVLSSLKLARRSVEANLLSTLSKAIESSLSSAKAAA
jgi:glycerol-3-phosphate acyltransferase PlsX